VELFPVVYGSDLVDYSKSHLASYLRLDVIQLVSLNQNSFVYWTDCVVASADIVSKLLRMFARNSRVYRYS